MSKIPNFYPLLIDFLNEADVKRVSNVEAAAMKIEDLSTVFGSDGKPIDIKKLQFEMESAKTAIISQSPLFAPYVHEFTPIYTWLVPTMGTDGVRLFVNPEFANKLTWLQKIFVIIHEIMHCVLLHQERGEGFDHEIFNQAGDLEINPIIIDTIEHFTAAIIKELDGLYDEKYLNMPAEQIYQDLLKNPLKQPKPKKGQPGQPGQGQGGGGKTEIVPGMKVRIKVTGQKGVVAKVNSNGTYEINPLNESFYPTSINESYKREEFIPILPPGQASQGGSGGSGEEVEIEGGQPGQGEGSGGKTKGTGTGKIGGKTGSEKQPGGQGEGGLGDPNGEVMREQLEKIDSTGTGSVLTREMGEKIAKASGYNPEEYKAGKDNKSVWENSGRKLLSDAQKITGEHKGGKGRGLGGGGALVKALGRLYKSTLDWKRVLKRYIADALSQEEEDYIGNKKYLTRPDFPLRRGERQKWDAIDKAIICVDVSGSMSDNTIQRILDEMTGLVFAKNINEIIIISFDGIVQHVQTLIPGDKIEVMVTRGGTEFQAPLDYIKEKYRDRVNLCIMFSDGGCPAPRRPKYWNKFIWIIYDDQDWVQPWGRLIKSVSAEM